MDPSDVSYDDEITVFSPDGRLFQVEYAREAVKKGSTTFGLKFEDGIVLMTAKLFHSDLVEVQALEKIFQIDDHIGCSISGLVADAQYLVEIARNEAQIKKIVYDENILVKEVVEYICEYKHLLTQFTGVRPFGAALLIAGIDEKGHHLFATDPSGAFFEYKAVSIGQKSDIVMKYFENNYQPDISMDAALILGVKTLKKVLRKKFYLKNIEIAIVNKTEKFRKLSSLEIQHLL